jgi:hypothetical protein
MHDIGETVRRRGVRRVTLVIMSAAMLGACTAASAPATIDEAQAEAPEPPMCPADRTLLAPQPAPDCEFGHGELKTLDPDQWARLKLEYERKCYQNAEQLVRKRLRKLQAANRCETTTAAR